MSLRRSPRCLFTGWLISRVIDLDHATPRDATGALERYFAICRRFHELPLGQYQFAGAFEGDHARGLGLVRFVVDLNQHTHQCVVFRNGCLADHVGPIGMISLAALDERSAVNRLWLVLSHERCGAAQKEKGYQPGEVAFEGYTSLVIN